MNPISKFRSASYFDCFHFDYYCVPVKVSFPIKTNKNPGNLS